MPKETEDQLLILFKEKKKELKDCLYGTVYKGYDQEEEAETVQQNVEDFFTDEWFLSKVSQVYLEGRKDCAEVINQLIPPEKYTGYGPWSPKGMSLDDHKRNFAKEIIGKLLSQNITKCCEDGLFGEKHTCRKEENITTKE